MAIKAFLPHFRQLRCWQHNGKNKITGYPKTYAKTNPCTRIRITGVLYQIDITRDSPDSALENFWQAHSEEKIEDSIKSFTAFDLVKGVVGQLRTIDQRISQYATNWQLERMAVVDRNILRLGSFELLFRDDIPPKVAINEAVDLAKRFSGIEAGKFVNGVLDKIHIEKNK